MRSFDSGPIDRYGANWAVRWLIVDTGAWLPGRKVLLPPSALGKPDSATRHPPAKLTMQ